jgi:hypothetical protein
MFLKQTFLLTTFLFCHSSSSTEITQKQCNICLDIITEEPKRPDGKHTQLGCKHTENYDESCLQKWFLTKEIMSCPECRDPSGILRIKTVKKDTPSTIIPSNLGKIFHEGRPYKAIQLGSLQLLWNPFIKSSEVLVLDDSKYTRISAHLLRRWKDTAHYNSKLLQRSFESDSPTIETKLIRSLVDASPISKEVSTLIDLFVNEGELIGRLQKPLTQAFAHCHYSPEQSFINLFDNLKVHLPKPADIFLTDDSKQQIAQVQKYRNILKIYK